MSLIASTLWLLSVGTKRITSPGSARTKPGSKTMTPASPRFSMATSCSAASAAVDSARASAGVASNRDGFILVLLVCGSVDPSTRGLGRGPGTLFDQTQTSGGIQTSG